MDRWGLPWSTAKTQILAVAQTHIQNKQITVIIRNLKLLLNHRKQFIWNLFWCRLFSRALCVSNLLLHSLKHGTTNASTPSGAAGGEWPYQCEGQHKVCNPESELVHTDRKLIITTSMIRCFPHIPKHPSTHIHSMCILTVQTVKMYTKKNNMLKETSTLNDHCVTVRFELALYRLLNNKQNSLSVTCMIHLLSFISSSEHFRLLQPKCSIITQ